MSTLSTLRLVSELYAGKNVGRAEAREILGTAAAAADAQLRSLVEALPIQRSKSRGRVFYHWKRDQTHPKQTLALSTVLAGYFGSSLARLFDQTAYASGMRKAAEALAKLSSRAVHLDNAERKFVFVSRGGELALPGKEAVLDELVQLLLDSRRCKVVYFGADGQRRTMVVDPLSIAIYDHQLYLIARRPDGSVHPFRFARIEAVTPLSARFEYPSRSEYDPEQIFRDSIGVHVDEQFAVEDVEVRISARWARFLRSHRWHLSQSVTTGPEGNVLKMRVRVCPELLRWALGFGGEAEVIRPELLRQQVSLEVRRMASTYGDGHSARKVGTRPAAKRRSP